MRSRAFTIFLLFVTLPALPDGPKEAILARMDKAASEFKNMAARATYVTHTDVINEDSPETGTVVMQKVAAGEVRGLINFLGSDKRTVSIENRRVRVYYPKINTVQEFDLGKDGEQLDQFLMIGFGTSGTALAKNYDVSVLPTETVKGLEGVKTIRLQVIPKTGEARKLITKLELWIPETGDPYPVQEKISEPSGDYRLITYTGIKTNQPLPPDALQLKTPQGVKTEYPGK
jgi:outer membrane lipoprotein-sorting protein